MHRHERVLVSWYIDPRYIPAVVLSDRQVTVGPKTGSDQTQAPLDGFTPRGRYDLFAALEALRLPTEFDAIFVWSDASRSNQPVNLEAFGCPKVLCLGDTQHLQTPLRTMIDYAGDAGYDFILSGNNRQHAHWFVEAGFPKVAWLPGLKVQSTSRPFSVKRKAELCFVGSTGQAHPRRTRLLVELSRLRPFPLVAMPAKRERAAEQYAASAVSLNCSLNGDLNMRVFEIIAAGGCLLTDRLSPQSGLDLILEDGKEYMGFDSIEECIDKTRFLLAHPDAALAIARAGQRSFEAAMRPDQRMEQLFDWVFHGRLDTRFRIEDVPQRQTGGTPSLSDRIRIYEQLQEAHRVSPSPSVLFMDGVPDIHVRDAADLRHLKSVVADGAEDKMEAKPREMVDGCTIMCRAQWEAASWDCVVATRDGKVPPSLRHRQLIRARAGCVTGAATKRPWLR